MNVQSRIEDLIKRKLLGRKTDCVGCVDELLRLTQTVGEIQCGPGRESRLRFCMPDQSAAFEVEVDAAISKLRMLCARLAVLCMENSEENILYGGEGVIKRSFHEESAVSSPAAQASAGKSAILHAGDSGSESAVGLATAVAERQEQWKVRHKNTPSEQEFTIRAL